MQPKIVLGLTGKFCAGKGEVATYLVEKHKFKSASFSDRIREEILRRDLEITRETLQAVGGEMRQKDGPTVLAARTWDYMVREGAEKAVVETLRSKEEAKYLKKLPNFYLVSVDAGQKIRFERMKARHREADPQTWEEFLVSEERDCHKDGRNIEACIQAADYHLVNEGTPEELYQQIDKLLTRLPTGK